MDFNDFGAFLGGFWLKMPLFLWFLSRPSFDAYALKSVAQVILRWELPRGIVVIPKSTHIERMAENFNVFDFELTEGDMSVMASLDKKQSSFFSHTDPNMVEWFVHMVEERKQNHDHSKDKKKW